MCIRDRYMKDKNYSSGLSIFKNKKNVFILRTFSKIYGLASLRVGWGYGDRKIVDALNIIKPPFNVNKIAQICACWIVWICHKNNLCFFINFFN